MPLTDADIADVYSDARHLAAVRVSGELLRDSFFAASREGEAYRITKGIPADARFVRWAIDDLHNELVCIYEHPSFPLTHPGQPVTNADSPQIMSIRIPQPMLEPGNPEGERMLRVLDELQQPSMRMMPSPRAASDSDELLAALAKSRTGEVVILPHEPPQYASLRDLTAEQRRQLGEAFEAGTLRVTMRGPVVVMDEATVMPAKPRNEFGMFLTSEEVKISGEAFTASSAGLPGYLDVRSDDKGGYLMPAELLAAIADPEPTAIVVTAE